MSTQDWDQMGHFVKSVFKAVYSQAEDERQQWTMQNKALIIQKWSIYLCLYQLHGGGRHQVGRRGRELK